MIKSAPLSLALSTAPDNSFLSIYNGLGYSAGLPKLVPYVKFMRAMLMPLRKTISGLALSISFSSEAEPVNETLSLMDL